MDRYEQIYEPIFAYLNTSGEGKQLGNSSTNFESHLWATLSMMEFIL